MKIARPACLLTLPSSAVLLLAVGTTCGGEKSTSPTPSASKLAFIVQPAGAQAGAPISPAVTVAVQDASGNTVSSATTRIAIVIDANPAGGTLSGGTTVAAVGGVATFSSLSLDKAGTGYTITAAAAGLTWATSAAFNVTAGAASKLAFTAQPSSTMAGSAILPAVAVTVQDASGNRVTTGTDTITLAITGGTGTAGAHLRGTTTGAVDGEGVATFSTLSIDSVGTGYSLTATATGLTSATSAPFSVTVAIAVVSLDTTELSFGHIGLRDTLHATARDDAGHVLSGVHFSWSSSDENIASVDTAGAVTTLGLGTAQITAAASGRAASARVSVQAASPEWEQCSGGTPTVLLLVEAHLRFPLTAELGRFASDLCADGYRVWLTESVPRTPPEIRAYLADAWSRSGQTAAGALLIGDIPHAYQFVVLHSTNPAIPDAREEVISFQYYADLNGEFSASSGYVGSHPYSYDAHQGDVNWELWIGVLPVYQGSTSATVEALKRYFDRNHAYRTGGAKPPRAFLEISELLTAGTAADDSVILADMRSGPFSWTPFSNSVSARLYFNSRSTGQTVEQGYAALEQGVADFTVQDAHGSYSSAGELTMAGVETTPVRTTFFWSSGCAIGDLDQAYNFLTSVVYSATSEVLVAKGTTNNSGGMGNNVNGFYGHNVATALAAGASFGAAIVAHVNAPLIYPWSDDREYFMATPIIVGDPTLRLRP